MAALRSRCGHYILVLFLLLLFFPRLISAVADWMLPHFYTWCGPSEFRMQFWNMLHAARWKRRTQKLTKKSPSGHHCTTLSGHNFANKAHIYRQSEKNLLSSNISSTCPHNMVNFSLLAAEIGSGVCGTPANFNGFRVLAALLHGTPVLGVSQTLRR